MTLPTNTEQTTSVFTGTMGSPFSKTPQGLKAERTRKEITKVLQRTRTKNNNSKQLKMGRLHRCHTQLDKWSLPATQKTKRRAALHKHEIQPPTYCH